MISVKKEDPAVEIIFGKGPNRRILAELSKPTGVPQRTLSNWRKDPGKIPKEKLDILIRVCNLTDEQILALHGRRKK